MTYRSKFFNKKVEFLTLGQLLEITGSTLHKPCDLSIKIHDISTLEKGQKDNISFLNSGAYFRKFQESRIGFCLIDEASANKASRDDVVCIINKNPYFAYSQIALTFYEEKKLQFVEGKLIHPSAKIGKNCQIAPNAYIGANVEIGDNCLIAPNATIYDNCKIGDNCVINSSAVISFAVLGNNCLIHGGVKIGQDGFGFAHNQGVNHKIIQLGIVEIANHVEIGANSCVDRGAIENTKIGDGVKIDNLVQVGHNVEIGRGCVIAGCAALAGSAKLGNFVQVGGNASIAGHLTVGDGAKVAGMSGVMRDIAPMETVGGIPSMPFRNWHRLNAKLAAMAKSHTKDE